MKTTLLRLTFALLLGTAACRGQLIGVDFNNDSSSPTHDPNEPGDGISPTFSGHGVLGESFIGISSAGTGLKLKDGVTLDITSTAGAIAFRDQYADGASDLFRDFVQSEPNETLTLTLHGLSPNTAYKLVGYGASSRSGKDATTFSGALVGTAVGWINGAPVSRSQFILNENYVESTAMTDATGTLSFTVAGTLGGWGILNGFGLVSADKAPPGPPPIPAAAPSTNAPAPGAPSTNAPSATPP